MHWLQLAVETSRPALAEAVLEGYGAQAISLQDAGEEALYEPSPAATPVWHASRVSGLFASDTDPAPIVTALSSVLELDEATVKTELIDDRDWVNAWREGYKPMRFGTRLWICPQGEKPPEAEAVVILEPGLAFGTGTHLTTALCLEWLDQTDLQGATMIDYGCGSGVLALAAAKLGAARVWATDHDPQALQATRDNAARNQVLEQLKVCAPESLPKFSAQVLLANILAGPLLELAPLFAERVAPEGSLILSGILDKQYPQIETAYIRDFEIRVGAERRGWLRLDAKRREDHRAVAK